MSSLEFIVIRDELTPFLDEVLRNYKNKELQILAKAGVNAWQEAVKLAQARLKHPGTYLQSFRVVVNQAEGKMTLANFHRAAAVIEHGTIKKGYRIPREGEGIWMFKEGQWKWRPFVIHPGLDAKRIMWDAFEKINPELLKDLTNLIGTPMIQRG